MCAGGDLARQTFDNCSLADTGLPARSPDAIQIRVFGGRFVDGNSFSYRCRHSQTISTFRPFSRAIREVDAFGRFGSAARTLSGLLTIVPAIYFAGVILAVFRHGFKTACN